MKAVMSVFAMMMVLGFAVPGYAFGSYGMHTTAEITRQGSVIHFSNQPRPGYEIPQDLASGLVSGNYYEITCFGSATVLAPRPAEETLEIFTRFIKADLRSEAKQNPGFKICNVGEELVVKILTPLENLKCYAKSSWGVDPRYFPALEAVATCVAR